MQQLTPSFLFEVIGRLYVSEQTWIGEANEQRALKDEVMRELESRPPAPNPPAVVEGEPQPKPARARSKPPATKKVAVPAG